MAFNEKVAKGTLGKSKKRNNDKAPEYLGSITVEQPMRAGEKLWLAAWLKTNEQNGDKFFSIVVERAAQDQQQAPQRSSGDRSFGGYSGGGGGRSSAVNDDDDIPF